MDYYDREEHRPGECHGDTKEECHHGTHHHITIISLYHHYILSIMAGRSTVPVSATATLRRSGKSETQLIIIVRAS